MIASSSVRNAERRRTLRQTAARLSVSIRSYPRRHVMLFVIVALGQHARMLRWGIGRRRAVSGFRSGCRRFARHAFEVIAGLSRSIRRLHGLVDRLR